MSERRRRTVYIEYSRYKWRLRLATLSGAVIGLAFTSYALVPKVMAGERLPPLTLLIAASIVLGLALAGRGLVRWRWKRVRRYLDDEA